MNLVSHTSRFYWPSSPTSSAGGPTSATCPTQHRTQDRIGRNTHRRSKGHLLATPAQLSHPGPRVAIAGRSAPATHPRNRPQNRRQRDALEAMRQLLGTSAIYNGQHVTPPSLVVRSYRLALTRLTDPVGLKTIIANHVQVLRGLQ